MDTSGIVNQDFLSRLNLQQPHGLKQVTGGDINLAYSFYANGQHHYFLKVQPNQDRHFFDLEVASLRALGQEVAVPAVVKQGECKGAGYLLLEWVNQGSGDQADLGRAVAQLHRAHAQQFGFDCDQKTDLVPKDNHWQDSWAEFFIKQRLEPMMVAARNRGFWLTQRGDHFENLKAAIRQDDHVQAVQPSLLHGDLWAGNYLFDETGQPLLIDPVAFYGDREFDIAVSTVFPGFGSAFYQAYQESYPLAPGYEERLRWYAFYYLLMHYVRFGDIYAPRLNQLLISF
ncbi:fructosamine kinase family protein [Leuconostocaceae bacterium ESL0958]|nr:fructosamine kinase family protein [Leuconostocaceae bacterium ESL0958]